MLAKLCADVLHYEINCHMIVSSVMDGWKASPKMDDGTGGMDGKLHFIPTSFTYINSE
jgi:hypothetical protein